MIETADIVIIGGGMAGASAAAHVADLGRVVLLEGEDVFGYHTTGRSAAVFDETYGNARIRAITASSRAFFEQPPDGFAEAPLLTRRGGVQFANLAQWPQLLNKLDEFRRTAPMMVAVDASQCLSLMPCLRPDVVHAGLYDPALGDLDVDALHQGFLKLAGRKGVALRASQGVVSARRSNGGYEIETREATIACGLVVNASGAWGDEVAAIFGIAPVGLQPKRRTAFLFDAPPGAERWPMLYDAGERFYMKPQGGQLLATPCDATPSPPLDAQPEEIDVAMGAALIEESTTLEIRRITHKWAGLRTFARDLTPVVGSDPEAPGFFWLVGQGGYGIQTAPAMGRITASLIASGDLPEDVKARGVSAADLSPARLR